MNWEIGVDACALPRVKHIASAAERRELSSVLCDDRHGWDGVGGGGRSKREGTHVHIKLIHLVV